MAEVLSIKSDKYNEILANALKKEKEFEKPEWVEFVKSGAHRERPIGEEDFWYKRSASILRQIYIREIVGVERLRTRYGGRKNRGKRPSKFRKGSGKIIRTILQQSEKEGFVEKANGKKKGRKLTVKGKEFLEKVAGHLGGNDDKTLSKKD
jgi:small subunit ribosomal protein S19e